MHPIPHIITAELSDLDLAGNFSQLIDIVKHIKEKPSFSGMFWFVENSITP